MQEESIDRPERSTEQRSVLPGLPIDLLGSWVQQVKDFTITTTTTASRNNYNYNYN